MQERLSPFGGAVVLSGADAEDRTLGLQQGRAVQDNRCIGAFRVPGVSHGFWGLHEGRHERSAPLDGAHGQLRERLSSLKAHVLEVSSDRHSDGASGPDEDEAP